MDGYAVRAADVASAPARSTVIGEVAGRPAVRRRGRPGRGGAHLHRRAGAGGRRHRRHPGERRRAGDASSRSSRGGAGRAHPRAPGSISGAAQVVLPAATLLDRRAIVRSRPRWTTRRCRCAGGRASPSWRPATSWCRPATDARPGPDRRLERLRARGHGRSGAGAERDRSRHRPRRPARGDRARQSPGARRRRRHPGHHRRRLGRRPRPRAARRCSARAWRSTSGRSRCGPGKPLMFGAARRACAMLGLPGNPVSAVVCARLFLVPLIAGAARASGPRRRCCRRGSAPLPANDQRAGLPAGDAWRRPRRHPIDAPRSRSRTAPCSHPRTRPSAWSCAHPHAPAGSRRRHGRNPGNRSF